MSARTAPLAVDAAEVDRVLGGRVLRWLRLRPQVIDVIVALACLVVQALALMLPGTQPLWQGLLLVIVSCALLLCRRRMPVAVLVAVALVSQAGMFLPDPVPILRLPVAVALYTLAVLRPVGSALLGYLVVVGIPALGTLALFLLTGEVRAPSLLDPLALLALALGVAARSATQRREALAELMNERLTTTRVLERQRITAEMHDVVAHSLSTMIALADGASDGWQKHPERSTRALGKLGEVGRSALTDMRRILQVLREDDAVLDDSLHRSGHNVPELGELIEVFRSTGMPVRLTQVGQRMPADHTLATTVYRIVQESLTNTLRYAVGATHVDVIVEVVDGAIAVTVSDDGHADPDAPSQGSGRGLLGIAERAASFGGTSAAGPRPGGGWTTSATLAIDE